METVNEAKIKIIIDKKIAELKRSYKEKREFDTKYKSLRINSIDFLRGILLIFTIFLICQGLENNVEKRFMLSSWNGFNIVDIVLPFFLLIMGMSLPFYVKKYYQDGRAISEIAKNILKRSIILFILGLVYSLLFMSSKDRIRLTGPYQLIAINYLICSMIYLAFLVKKIKNNALTYVFLILGSIVSIIFTILAFKDGMTMEKNIFIELDKTIFQGITSPKSLDSEGILATFAALPFAMYGLSIGCILNKKHIEHKKYIRYKRSHRIRERGFTKENLWIDLKSRLNIRSIKSFFSNYYRINNEAKKVVNLFLLGLLFIVISAIIGIWIPMNRNVFSISFVLRVSAIMFFLIDVLYIFFDIIKLNFATNLIRKTGQNAIFVIFFITIVNKLINLIKLKSIYTGTWMNFNNWFTTDFLLPVTGIEKASSAYALIMTIIWLLLLNFLDKYDIKLNV